MPLSQALLADPHGLRRGGERVVLLHDQADRILLELLRKHPPLSRRFSLRLAHPSNLHWEPLSGSRRCPKVLGYRTLS
jgi:hypothetical protein